MLLVAVVGLLAVSAKADESTDAATAVALEWLGVVDRGNAETSWQTAAPVFQSAVTTAQWSEAMLGMRKPLGELKSRKVRISQYTTSLPGAPAGEYVVIQFDTDFTNKPGAVETVTPMKVDGSWRVSGYYIR